MGNCSLLRKSGDSFYKELKEYAGNVLADKETWKRIKTGKEFGKWKNV